MDDNQRGLLVVMAHPDDESMGSGGLILRHTRAGIATHLICATYGEAGGTGKPPPPAKEEPGEKRANEQGEGAAAPGVSGGGVWGYPQGGGARAGQRGSPPRVPGASSKRRPPAG